MRRAVFLFILVTALFTIGCSSTPVQQELAETYFNLGNAYFDLEKWDEAESAYAKALQIEPELYRAGYNMARLYIHREKYEEALELLQGLLEQNSGNVILRENLAWVYLSMGREDKAVQLYRDVLDDDPANCNVRYNLSRIAERDEEWERAYSLLIECVYLEEADSDILLHLAKAEQGRGSGSGLEWLQEARQLDPQNEAVILALARAYVFEEDFTEALNRYDQLLNSTTDGEKGLLHFEKASLLYTAIEDWDRGLQELQLALESGFDEDEKIRTLLDEIGYREDQERFFELKNLLERHGLPGAAQPEGAPESNQ